MKFIRENKAFRIIWLVVTLNILNCSVDAPDVLPNHIPEDLSYNDMESIVEIVLEQVLKIDNAVVEYDEYDDDILGSSSGNTVDFSYHQSKTKLVVVVTSIHLIKHPFYQEQYSEQFHPGIIPPPPQA